MIQQIKAVAVALYENFMSPRTQVQLFIGDTISGLLILAYFIFRKEFVEFSNSAIGAAVVAYLLSRLATKPPKNLNP